MFRLLAVEHDPDTVGVVTSFELENFFVQREKNILASPQLNFPNIENSTRVQGCQMVYFETKNPYLGTFWRALEWKMLAYFTIYALLV
jgi:hypothetical protein